MSKIILFPGISLLTDRRKFLLDQEIDAQSATTARTDRVCHQTAIDPDLFFSRGATFPLINFAWWWGKTQGGIGDRVVLMNGFDLHTVGTGKILILLICCKFASHAESEICLNGISREDMKL